MFNQHGGYQELCYMKEILDSAQENYPHLWVNGEKYVFSDDVIEAGDKLFSSFNQVKKQINDFVRSVEENASTIKFTQSNQQIKDLFTAFDEAWT